MTEDASRERSLYQGRMKKEIAVTEQEIEDRVRWDLPILAENKKCSVSLDLPLTNCKPTKACAEVCYAAQGRQSFPGAVTKSLSVNRMTLDDPERAARKIVDEAAGRPIRLAGSGELLPEHKTLTDYIEHYGGSWWGFTRRIDTHQAMPRLMFSIDATTPGAVLDYVRDHVPVDRRAYLRRPQDPDPPMDVAVTFPTHGPWTNYVGEIPEHETDCPEIRGAVEGCWRCKRCY